MQTGIELIARERDRQINEEGWTAEHDMEHIDGELACAAACYATPWIFRRWRHNGDVLHKDKPPYPWPFADKWWKPTDSDRIAELVKAGALIAAEIDRLNALY